MAIDSRQIGQINSTTNDLVLSVQFLGTEAQVNSMQHESTTYVTLTLPEYIDKAIDFYIKNRKTVPENVDGSIKPFREYANNPEKIAEIVKSGKAQEVWNVGDTIPIKLSKFKLTNNSGDTNWCGGETYEAVILGFDHNIEKEFPSNSGTVPEHTMTLALMYSTDDAGLPIENRKPIAFCSPSASPYDIETIGLQYIFNALPDDWEQIIASTYKNGGKPTTAVNTSNPFKVFPLSYYEAHGNNLNIPLVNSAEYKDNRQKQYEFFRKYGFPDRFLSQYGKGTKQVPIIVASRSQYQSHNTIRVLLTMQTDGTVAYSIRSAEYSKSKEETDVGIIRYYPDIIEYKNGSHGSGSAPNFQSGFTIATYKSMGIPSSVDLSYNKYNSLPGNIKVLLVPRAGFIPCFTIC